MSVSWTIRSFDTLNSSQLTLKEIHKSEPDLNEGLVVHALNQTEGQGRHGRTWEQGAGNLYLSFMIKPDCPLQNVGHISLLTSLAVNKTIHDYIPNIKTKLKWPNDILIKGQKCCGILIETLSLSENTIDSLAIGIGVNLNSSPIKGSTNINCHGLGDIDLLLFRNRLLDNFSQYYTLWQKHGFEKFLNEWLSYSYDKGSDISVKSGDHEMTGQFETVDADANLIMMCNKTHRLRKITSGEVFIL